ncbi:MAG: hypothetical protein IKH07_07320 [Oscillospiraceae bacterium]|nr:hypothetical protein [Oscillospiraceae bacterium]
MGERLKQWRDTERKKLRSLSGKEAIEYIWNYYKLWIIGIAFFLFITIFLAVRISNNIEGYWLYGIFANTMTEAGTGSERWEDFTDYAQLDLSQKKVEFNASSYFDYLKDQAKGNDYYNAFVALADAGILDFVTMEPASLEALAQSGRLTDLRLERCKPLLERYRDRVIWFHSAESGDIPVGFDISDSLLVTRYRLYPTGCALGVAAHSENLDNVALFLQFVLKEG